MASMALAEQLKTYRQKAGFSQSAVAEELNISRQSISKWENGRAFPDIDNLVLLSRMYEVSIDELLKENEELKKKISENKVEINEKKQTLKYIRKNLITSEKDEGLVLLVIAVITALTFPLGFIIVPFIIRRNKKQTHYINLFM